MKRDTTHGIIYGVNGSGKTTFLSGTRDYYGIPGPRLVIHADGFGKESSWKFASQKIYKLRDFDMGGGNIIPSRELVGYDGERTRIEYYHSESAYSPVASALIDSRLQSFQEESKEWESVVVDSISALMLEARYYDKMVMNPVGRSGKEDKWSPYNASRDLLERLIINQRSWHCNVFFIVHEKYDIVNDGLLKPTFALPGQMPFEIGKYFSDILRCYVEPGPEKTSIRMVQTDHNGENIALNHMYAPNPIEAKWDELWVNWDNLPDMVEEDYPDE